MALRQGRNVLRYSWNSLCVENFIPGCSIKELHTRSFVSQLSQLDQAPLSSPSGAWWARLPACQPQTRWFRSSQAVQLEVEIQSMGESISEGTIAEVLKAEGDAVAEDETIAQIETDKVTIDVKAPSAGTLTELRIKEGDTVQTGQVVAVISEGAGGESTPKKAGSCKPSPTQNEEAHPKGGERGSRPSQSEKEGGSHEKAEGGGGNEAEGRKASIKFPERMSGGKRISQMTDEERSKIGGSAPQPAKEAVPAAKAAKESQPKKAIWYVGTEQGTKLSQSQVLTQREMDQIELGGAEP